MDLWVQGKACWLGDIAIVLRRLGFTEDELSLESLLNPEDAFALIKAVPQKCSEWAQNQIQSPSRLELMRDRVERLRGGRLSSEPLLFRSYLLVRIRDHRVALTRLLTASHTLAVERGRWMTVRNSSVHVPRAFRLCRMCHDDVEDEIHILFTCSHSDLEDLRNAFLADVWKTFPALRYASSTPMGLFHKLLMYTDLHPRLARYVYEACQEVEKIAMYIHPGVT